MAVNAARDLPNAAAAAAIVALAFLPMAKMPAFYESFIYLIFFWVSLSTSWALLSGFAGYFSLGHAAFFGVGVYTTAALTTKFGVPFLVTVPVAAALAALLAGMLIGASESIAIAVLAPAWAPVVSFSVLIAILLWDPEWL